VSRTTRDRQTVERIQARIDRLERQANTPQSRTEIKKLNRDFSTSRADIEHLMERVEELEGRVTELEES
jgi:predicted  nucleic acid-binding Zn-ribbon protein